MMKNLTEMQTRIKEKGMWKLLMYNTNHPNKEVVVIKSTCLPLLMFLMKNLDNGFKKFQYRDKFQLEVRSCDSGGIVATDSTIPESKL
jgi:hypothetical protein